MFDPVPCEHIRAYYHHKWLNHKCIAYNFLRRGYREWSAGTVTEPFNDLYQHGIKP